MKKDQVLASIPLITLIILFSTSHAQEHAATYWDPLSQKMAEIDSEKNNDLLGQSGSGMDTIYAADNSDSVDDPYALVNPIIQLKNIPSGRRSTPEDLRPLSGSRREPLKGSKAIGSPKPDERIEVTLILRSKSADAQFRAIENAKGANDTLGRKQKFLSREEFAASSHPSQKAITEIKEFALRRNLTITQVRSGSNSIVLSGTSEAIGKAFGTQLMLYESPKGVYRGYTGELEVPSELEPLILGVFGLDNRTIARPYYIRSNKSYGITYTPQQITKLYNFPPGLDGSGQCIAIIELGGSYRIEDVENYFKWLKMRTPEIIVNPVDGAVSQPGSDADGEVILDIDMAGGVAPGAKIVIYLAPNTERGFIDAVNAAVHDTANKPSALSISWGDAECNWTLDAVDAMDQAFQAATAMGVTVFCASGDDGSRDGISDLQAHVDYPASSRYVTGCGGTKFDPTGEVAWNDGPNGATGGGVSDLFPTPIWQQGAGVPPSANPDRRSGRGVPDIAGNADLETGYILILRGELVIFGGTSAVAPMWAGLTALINQNSNSPVGYLNPSLYSMANSSAFNDIRSGNNGHYQATAGWDACTGWGSPDGVNLMNKLMKIDTVKGLA